MLDYDLTQGILIGLRNQGIDVPSLANDAGANAHFGEERVAGSRYYNTDAEVIKVFNGTAWIVQKSKSC